MPSFAYTCQTFEGVLQGVLRDQVIARAISAIGNCAAMPPEQSSLKNTPLFRATRGGRKFD